MNSLSFDYAQPSHHRSTPRRRIALVLAALSALVAVGFWAHAVSELKGAQAHLTARHTSLNAQQKQTANNTPPISNAIQSALHVLSLPLPTLLRALQPPSEIGGNIGIVAFELLPATQGAANAARALDKPLDTQRIRLTAHADTLNPAADYLAYLSKIPGTADAQLVRHEFVTEPGTQYVLFVIDLSWRHDAH